ncbi:L-aspartate oxidase [Desulfurispira natronophila]|uniref:L-aspartate oxidase n=1 Tax=Desulfurispira natronophila TaxID=682562 RepID=A0A7W7Y661_9BACT|nr:L-aspartate oxidase [Desulfurispira natronophila]MBB5022659.1 L-aspartate oxidase [Desulfurispira natronophila]
MQSFDYIVLGGGGAGLTAAITLAEHNQQVLVLNKSEFMETNTNYAQGGVAVVMDPADSFDLHVEDTMNAGAHLNNRSAVEYLVRSGPHLIHKLINWGTEFDRDDDSHGLKLTREAAHSLNRIIHARGDATGQEVQRAMVAKARSMPNITLWDNARTVELIQHEQRVRGACFVREGQAYSATAKGVILATGGLGRIYGLTTNPEVATGDGTLLALYAGAKVADMEFVQFHPTALNALGCPPFLLSESMRGEGGILLNHQGDRFMERYSSMLELAPRDVVSRSIHFERERTGKDVYLQVSHLGADFVRQRFPSIYQTCLGYGLDISRDPAPVSPAAHYAMGGVITDITARTGIPGLYAAGEVACTSVHGANRLASNSILEGLVFGERAALSALEDGRSMMDEECLTREQSLAHGDTMGGIPAAMQEIMWKCAGIVRSQELLEEGMRKITAMNSHYVLLCASIISGALRRRKNIGAHYRTDSLDNGKDSVQYHADIKSLDRFMERYR